MLFMMIAPSVSLEHLFGIIDTFFEARLADTGPEPATLHDRHQSLRR